MKYMLILLLCACIGVYSHNTAHITPYCNKNEQFCCSKSNEYTNLHIYTLKQGSGIIGCINKDQACQQPLGILDTCECESDYEIDCPEHLDSCICAKSIPLLYRTLNSDFEVAWYSSVFGVIFVPLLCFCCFCCCAWFFIHKSNQRTRRLNEQMIQSNTQFNATPQTSHQQSSIPSATNVRLVATPAPVVAEPPQAPQKVGLYPSMQANNNNEYIPMAIPVPDSK